MFGLAKYQNIWSVKYLTWLNIEVFGQTEYFKIPFLNVFKFFIKFLLLIYSNKDPCFNKESNPVTSKGKTHIFL